ncbi:methyltransferase [Sarocladium implicatum]|nr:methyltransferase [Sarocladium implicatum]
MTVNDTVPRGPVQATLNFFNGTDDNSPPYTWIEKPKDPSIPERNYNISPQQVTINDARGREAEFTLDRDAFQILQSQPPSAEKDFTDDASIEKNYYPEVEKLLRDNIPDVSGVRIFDHTIRRSRPDAHRTPVSYAHVDQTLRAVEKRIHRYYSPEEAEKLLKGRFRIVNVWRPLNKSPVEHFPLAYASAKSASDDDFVPVELRYPEGYRGETASIRYNEKQQWYYLSGMTGDERVLLECFDSESLKPGSSIRGQVPHSAFEDPRTREDAERRESIEVRALVFGP